MVTVMVLVVETVDLIFSSMNVDFFFSNLSFRFFLQFFSASGVAVVRQQRVTTEVPLER